MALSRSKYKRVPDLYVQGTEVVLKDGTVAWVQVLNPFETEEARHDAQVARSRLVMALKEHGGDEINFIETALWQDGLELARKRVVESKSQTLIFDVVTEIKNDPDWTERLDILDRTEEEQQGLEDVEKELLRSVQREYVLEVQKRVADSEAFLIQQYKDADFDELREEYKRLYIDRRGADIAGAEYRIVEVWYGARVCEGIRDESGEWDHSACEGHQVQIFETKAEVRGLPADLAEVFSAAYDALSMTIRDAKDLVRLASSSDSSRQPSEVAESTPSTPTETPASAPGTSPQPSPTPSPS